MQGSPIRPTILVAEDEPEVRGYFETALRCFGYAVELAQDGDEALARLQAPGPEISAVLLDLMMPRRDGLETLREIRAMNSRLPVIVVSEAASTVNAVAAMKYGATDFLGKPVAHQELREALGRALAADDPAYPSLRDAAKSTHAFM